MERKKCYKCDRDLKIDRNLKCIYCGYDHTILLTREMNERAKKDREKLAKKLKKEGKLCTQCKEREIEKDNLCAYCISNNKVIKIIVIVLAILIILVIITLNYGNNVDSSSSSTEENIQKYEDCSSNSTSYHKCSWSILEGRCICKER